MIKTYGRKTQLATHYSVAILIVSSMQFKLVQLVLVPTLAATPASGRTCQKMQHFHGEQTTTL